MSDTSPTLSMPYLLPSQAQKHVTHNEALQLLDVAVQTVVADRDRTEPPGSPALGDCHIVAAGAIGGWAGHSGSIAQFDGSDWGFVVAKPGWRAQVLSESKAVVFDGADWFAQVSVPDTLDNLDGVGVGTTSDPTNRLAVAAGATLLSHDGAGHQLKINKSGAGDTASLLFQTGWSGRAEMGVAGSDDFAIKVSADGANWVTGMAFDAATGQAALPQGAQIDADVTGLAVQQSADDTTSGRLMRADYGYGPGNLLGPVAQSGGAPVGAVIERGNNANGSYVRFADGTQICRHRLDDVAINSPLGGTGLYQSQNTSWVFPAAFANDAGPSGPYVAARANHYSVIGTNVLWFGMTSSAGAVRITGSISTTVDVQTLAIGRWI